MAQADGMLSSVERYDVAADTWEARPCAAMTALQVTARTAGNLGPEGVSDYQTP